MMQFGNSHGSHTSLLTTQFCRYQVYVTGDVTEWLKEESEVGRSISSLQIPYVKC